MAALTGDRKTKRAKPGLRAFNVKANVIIFEGALVHIATDGYARPGRTSATDICVGLARHRVDNTGGTDGVLPDGTPARVLVDSSEIAFLNNSAGGDLIAVTDVGKDCYVVDDQTVALTHATNTRVRAGKIDSVTADGVGVRFDQ